MCIICIVNPFFAFIVILIGNTDDRTGKINFFKSTLGLVGVSFLHIAKRTSYRSPTRLQFRWESVYSKPVIPEKQRPQRGKWGS